MPARLTSPDSTIPLSVVVVSFNGPQRLSRCLESIAPQIRDGEVEVLVTANWTDLGGPRAALGHEFPAVQWVPVPTTANVPMMRQQGIAASRGRVVALIEDDCTASPGWCRAVLTAHEGPDVAIGGAVEPGPYRRPLDWAVFFCEYGRFMPPLPARQTADLAGNNLSYKRTALADLPRSNDGFLDFVIHRDWAAAGRPMRADPTVVIQQANSWGWRQVTAVPFHHGRSFAGSRFTGLMWPLRAGLSGLALLLPVLSVARVARTVLGRRRFTSRLLAALPWIVVFTASWALGEATGYLRGTGDSLNHWR